MRKRQKQSMKETTKNKALNPVLVISATFMGLFVLWGAVSPDTLGTASGSALNWITERFGWFYMLLLSFFVLFGFILILSPFGRLKLGKKEDEPEFSYISWIGMLFAAGIGVGFVFFGVAEPVLNYLNPPPEYTAETRDAAEAGLRYAVYHWGLHAWGVFSVVGLTLAYVMYRKNRPALISSAFYPLLGNQVNGWAGRGIDILAVIATCAGVATTFGLSAMQISGGLSYISPIPNNIWTQLVIIAVVGVLFILSALVGIEKGIKRLTNLNLTLALILMMFVLFFGPTLYVLNSIVHTLGGYVSNFVSMATGTETFNNGDWLAGNTIFFWAWHMSWSPFVGMFIARISKGRTVREFMAGVLLVPTALALIWFSIFGGTALNFELEQGISSITNVAQTNEEVALFAMLGHLPMTTIMSILGLIVIFIFFITSADSATFVLGTMTDFGNDNPAFKLKVLWGALIAGTAGVLLLSSGSGGLDALQTAAITAALPFSFILLFMVLSVFIMMSRDFQFERRKRNTRRISSIKEEIREDMYAELKDEVSEEIKGDLRGNTYEEFKDEIRENVYDEFKEELRDEIYEEVRSELQEDGYEKVSDSKKDEEDRKDRK
ncbi:BCCT family transporter [Shouchella shacheensis]|uniref:BCCT family transporter n=1 Tax=Shouchella shacheensis TaxID=1649580 RepID=UPI00073FE402|nr:BCCT family transporter [Shouchella shacheensis]